MSQIPVEKTVFEKDFDRVVDTQFHQLLTPDVTNIDNEITVDEFFELYEKIFFQIPKEGDTNSHRYILQREADYLGVKLSPDVDVDALLEEITTLRQQLLDANKTIDGLNSEIS